MLILGLAVLIGFSGCATGGGSQEEIPAEWEDEPPEDQRTRIWNVSDDEESPDQMGPFVEEPDPEPEPEREGDYFGPSTGEVAGDLFRNTWEETMFWYSRSSLAGDAPPGFSLFSILLSRSVEENNHMYIGLYYGKGRDARGREIQDKLRWVTEAGFDVGTRAYVGTDLSAIGLFGVVGVRAGGNFCSYTDAMDATNGSGDTNTYSHDAVWVTTPYVGGGVSFGLGEETHLGVNASFGYRVIGERTYHDLEPDLFKSVWEFKVNFEVIINPGGPDNDE